jgi:pimeloyl-ACP methyl ester carboxylesterase
LFLHHWGGSARTWNAVTLRLSTDFRSIAYDQRGWGQSDAPAQGYAIQNLALDAKHVIEALHLCRYVLIGHSIGGKVAQFFASQRPIRLEGLVLVAPAPPTPQNIPEPAKQAQLHAYDNRVNALQALAFPTAFPPSGPLREQILPTTSPVHRKPSSPGRHPPLSEDISGVVGHIAVPTLILAADQDRQDPLEQHEREVLPRIPGAKITVIRDSGHLLPIDQPIQLADAIRNFVITLSAR